MIVHCPEPGNELRGTLCGWPRGDVALTVEDFRTKFEGKRCQDCLEWMHA